MLERFCAQQGWTFEVVADLGSGMNYHEKGLKRLLADILAGRVGRLVITHKDRLLRFGAKLVFAICEAKNVEVVILSRGEDTTFEEDLEKDVLEIITVFSARLYGARSRKNKRLLDDIKRALAFGLLILVALAGATAVARAATSSSVISLGDDAFLADGWRELHGRCIGIVTNASGVTSAGENFVDAVRRHGHICVRALFAPEHGLRGDRPAGSYVASYTDVGTGLPVYSLYGATRHPSATMLDGVDVLVFDIQDVGARPYTYVSTMAYVMESAAAAGKEIWVLDRPNPIGGTIVEGPVLNPTFKSFVGLYPIPERHGMTVGELARLFNDEFHIGAKLRVIPMSGWRRDMVWAETGLSWTATSPNIPYAKTTLVYLATGLIDEAGINNGVGSDKPFERAGVFGMDANAYAAALNARHIPGVHFTPAAWTPTAGFWKGKPLTGVEIDVDDPHTFPSVRTAVELLCAARDLGPYVRVHNARTMDVDWGTDTVRKAVLAGESPDAIVHAWQAKVPAFLALRDKYLLY